VKRPATVRRDQGKPSATKEPLNDISDVVYHVGYGTGGHHQTADASQKPEHRGVPEETAAVEAKRTE
jgi:hypothetical protein